MADNHDKLITNLVLIGAGYFLVVKPLLQKIGLEKSDKDKEVDTTLKSNGWDPNFYKNYKSPVSVKIRTQAFINSLAQQIYRAWGLFNDDEQAIFAALKQCRSLLELSQLSDAYSRLYKRDLLGELTSPWNALHDGLTPDEMAYVANFVNRLPVAIKA